MIKYNYNGLEEIIDNAKNVLNNVGNKMQKVVRIIDCAVVPTGTIRFAKRLEESIKEYAPKDKLKFEMKILYTPSSFAEIARIKGYFWLVDKFY